MAIKAVTGFQQFREFFHYALLRKVTVAYEPPEVLLLYPAIYITIVIIPLTKIMHNIADSYFGTLRIKVRKSKNLKRKIMGWIDGMGNHASEV